MSQHDYTIKKWQKRDEQLEDFAVYLESAYSIPPVHSPSRDVGVIH